MQVYIMSGDQGRVVTWMHAKVLEKFAYLNDG